MQYREEAYRMAYELRAPNHQGRKGSIRPLTDRGRLNSGQNGPCSEDS